MLVFSDKKSIIKDIVQNKKTNRIKEVIFDGRSDRSIWNPGSGSLAERSVLLLDGGVEKRWKEPYAFHNTDRGTYSGWLMQYTLSGTGWFEKTEKRMKCVPGEDFVSDSGE